MEISKTIKTGLVGILALLTILFGLGFFGIMLIASKTGGDPLSMILLVFCGGAFLVGIISVIVITKTDRKTTVINPNQNQNRL